MKKRKIARVSVAIIVAVVLFVGGYFAFLGRNRPAPIPAKETLYEGVTYQRVVKYFPSATIAHIIKIDTKTKGIQFLVTPADSKVKRLNARTTSQFLDEFGLQIAVNGDGFTPWWSRGPADYYPHAGDPVAPLGFTASNGDDYWKVSS
ncbi:MAG: hypothetical protein U0V48_05000 [Anaerolineales bacterium]